MGDVPEFQIQPPLRCFHKPIVSPADACAAPARWLRGGPNEPAHGFFCDAHRETGDVPIPPSFLFRRVAVTVQVLFSGASLFPVIAEAEALAKLRGAVEGVGGVMNLHALTSVLGRHTAPRAPDASRVDERRPKGRTLRH
jgi:hypothetical protein